MLVTAGGLLTVAATAARDYAAGRELSLSLFYAVPVFLVARSAPGRAPLTRNGRAWATMRR